MGRICSGKGLGGFPKHRGRHADLKAEQEYPGEVMGGGREQHRGGGGRREAWRHEAWRHEAWRT